MRTSPPSWGVCFGLWIAIVGTGWSPAAAEEPLSWRSVGIRGGIDDHLNHEDFRQIEAFATWTLPWKHAWESGWTLGTHLELCAGQLEAADETGFVGSVGPGVQFTTPSGRVDLSVGFNPTYISRHVYGVEDLGGPLAFTTRVGVDVFLGRGVQLGYRWQHMSNANIYDSNPGVNVHMLSLAFLFRR